MTGNSVLYDWDRYGTPAPSDERWASIRAENRQVRHHEQQQADHDREDTIRRRWVPAHLSGINEPDRHEEDPS